MARARLADVAASAGVSMATVSLVLRDLPGPSEQTRAAVHTAAAELGYRPDRSASALARKRSHLLGVVLDVSHPFHGDLVDALDAAVAGRGLDLVLSATTSRRDERAAVETLLDSRCAGVLLLGSTQRGAALDELADLVPTVVVGRSGSARARGVWADDGVGLRLAVDHLVSLGHEQITWVDGGRGPISTARRRGYRAAMATHGLMDLVGIVPAGSTEASGVPAGERVLASGSRPTALVTYNDRCAVGIREVLLRAGIDVPGDVSLVGYDDSPLARLATVDLTSVSQDPAAIATQSIAVMARLLDGDPDVRDVVVEPRLVVRGSTAAPRVG